MPSVWTGQAKAIRILPVTSFRPSLVAVFVACVTLAAPAQAQFDIFHRQAPPPADIPGAAPGDPDDAAGLVVRINRLEEELRQAYGRIEELQNAQRRLEAQLQKFRQDVEFRLGDRSGGAPPDSDVAEAPLAPEQPAVAPRPRRSDAFDPNADPNAPGAPRPLGTTPPSAPLVRESPAPSAHEPPAQALPSNSVKDRRLPHSRADRWSSAPGLRCSINRVSSTTPRYRPFRPGNTQRRRLDLRRFSPRIQRIA